VSGSVFNSVVVGNGFEEFPGSSRIAEGSSVITL
jgi:hypothetical protein